VATLHPKREMCNEPKIGGGGGETERAEVY
jgi:hypothetical protein